MRKRRESTSGRFGGTAWENDASTHWFRSVSFFPKPWAQGSRCVALALGPSQRCSLPIVIHAHHWRAFAITFSAQGTLMMRKPRLDRHLRIIGMPRRSVAKYGGSLPMMRFAQRSCVYRIISMPSAPSCIFRRRTANDAVVTTVCVDRIIGMPFMPFA